MRLGKREKTSRSWKKAGEKVKPKNVSPESVVGRISCDWISTVYAPKFEELTKQALEKYADDMMEYEDLMKVWSNTSTTEIVNEDGSTQRVNPPVMPTAPLFGSKHRIEEFSSTLSETAEHFFAKSGGWRVNANAAKFERMLDEKYGIFRPFVTNHPEIEVFIRAVQRKYAMGEFSPFRRGDPPIPRSTAVILLFMMQRGGLQTQILLFAALFFLVGLQPWALMAMMIVLQTLKTRHLRRNVGLMKRRIKLTKPYYYTTEDTSLSAEAEERRKHELLLKRVGTPLNEKETIDTSAYDTIILGWGTGCLYAASLLSRAGRRVLVLCHEEDASACGVIEKVSEIPIDLESHNLSKISKQQNLLAPALCSESDCQGGIRFAQVGSVADGQAFEILSIPGVGSEKIDHQIPFVLKAAGGLQSFMDDTAAYLGDGWPAPDGTVGQSSVGAYVESLEKVNAAAGEFFLTKILPENSRLKSSTASTYQNASAQYAETFLNSSFPLNSHTRSLMAGIGLKGENLRPSKASMAVHVTNVSNSMSGEGMHYPIGGPRALCHALAAVVEQSGGRILTEVKISELLFEEHKDAVGVVVTADGKEASSLPPPTCVGVKLGTGAEIRFASDRPTEGPARPVVVSTLPFIQTFIRLFPSDIRTKYGCPRGLAALAEQRPVFHIMFIIKGSASDLNLTGADYYRLPGAARPLDELDPATNQVKFGEIGWADEDEVGAAALVTPAEAPESETAPKTEDKKRRKHRKAKKYEPGVSWMHISFPSAKDPSFDTRCKDTTTCIVTIEADDDFVTDMGTNPRMFSTKKITSSFMEGLNHLQGLVQKEVIDIYPQLEGKIIGFKVTGPRTRGLSHTPERFIAKGVRADTPYRNLYYGGSDLTVGESLSASLVAAWLVSNAVAGYDGVIDHLLQKNITTDLVQFMESPGVNEEDVAVPFQIPDLEQETKDA